MKIIIINGPNLNFLGIRDKEVYGREDFASLLEMIRRHAGEIGAEVDFFQSNSEGGLIDRIQAAYRDGTEGMVINPGAYSHYSYALRDALDSYHTFPKIEVHISDIMQREDFRHTSVTGEVCDYKIVGHGLNGYLEAMDMLVKWDNKELS